MKMILLQDSILPRFGRTFQPLIMREQKTTVLHRSISASIVKAIGTSFLAIYAQHRSDQVDQVASIGTSPSQCLYCASLGTQATNYASPHIANAQSRALVRPIAQTLSHPLPPNTHPPRSKKELVNIYLLAQHLLVSRAFPHPKSTHALFQPPLQSQLLNRTNRRSTIQLQKIHIKLTKIVVFPLQSLILTRHIPQRKLHLFHKLLFPRPKCSLRLLVLTPSPDT